MNNSLISKSFKNSSAKTNKPKMLPFSLRFTAEERAWLDRRTGGKSLAAYIRDQVLGDAVAPRKKALRRPNVDQKALAQALGALGQSRLSSNLNQIAKAANQGTFPVSPELATELSQACSDIAAMRSDLIAALGLKSEE